MANLATITTNILADSGIDDINVIVSTGSYSNPAWITALAWTKITGAPAFVTNVTATSPLFSSGGATPNLTIQQASGSQNGFLSSTDWVTFNSKQPAGNYVTTDTNQSITGFKSFTNGFSLATAGGTNQATTFKNIGTIHEGSAGTNQIGFNNSNNIYFGKGLSNGGVLQWTNAAVRYYTLPDADGTIALTSSLGAYLPLTGGTLTGALNGTTGVFSGDLQSSTRVIAVNGGESIILHPNSGGSINRIEGSAGAPLHIVTSGSSLAFAAGGTTPQMILSNVGNLSLSGTATFSSSSGIGVTVLGTAAAQNLSATTGYARFYQGGGFANINIGALTSGSFAGWLQVSDGVGTSIPLAIQPSGGNVLINTTTDSGFRLDVNGTGRFQNTVEIATMLSVFYGDISTGNNRGIRIVNTDSIEGTAYNITAGRTGQNNGDFVIRNTTTGVNNLFFNRTTGAATFSSSLRATEITASMPSGNGALYINNSSLSNKNWTFIPQTSSSETDLLLFYTGASAGTRLTVTNGGNVGIGTTAPTNFASSYRTLALNGSSASVLEFKIGDTSSAYLISDGTSSSFTELGNRFFTIGTNSTERMRITSSGNVLIGTTTDNGARLQVNGSATFSSSVTAVGNIITTGGSFFTITNGRYGWGSGSVYVDGDSNNDFIRFITANSERMRITSGGNLEFLGSATGLAGAYFTNDNSSLKFHSTFGGNTTKDLILQSGGSSGAPQLILKAGGNVLIGTTTDNGEKLQVNGSGVFTSVLKAQFLTAENNNSSSPVIQGWNKATSGDNKFIEFYTEGGGGTLRGSIDFNRASGLVRYNATSDANLKNIIGDSDKSKSVEILNSTRIREYSWKEDETNKPQIGVIAQELYETFKGAVSEGSNDELLGTEEYKPWAVDKTAFTFHLIAGWQEHQRIIKELQEQINKLKNA